MKMNRTEKMVAKGYIEHSKHDYRADAQFVTWKLKQAGEEATFKGKRSGGSWTVFVKARRDEATQAVKTTMSANEAILSRNADLGDMTQAEANRNMLRMNGYSLESRRERADRLAYQIDGFDAWCKLIDEIRREEKKAI